jgi:NADH-quinone oxidoreductase subunit C
MMFTESYIKTLEEKFKSGISAKEIKNPKRAVLDIDPVFLPAIAEHLFRTEGYRFIIASAMHTKKGFEIHYHFSKDSEGGILNLHVKLDRLNPEIESLSNMFNASNWIEREMHELFGINFRNHPNQEKLISEGNWAEGVYPMKKEFK